LQFSLPVSPCGPYLLQNDPVIVLANGISLLLLANILYFKLREVFGRKGVKLVTDHADPPE
jgi:hypothetical protein